MGLVDYRAENHIVVLTMKRGDKKNALNEELLADLRNAWIRFRDDDDAWIGIITGEGNVFSAGADKSFIERFLQGEDFWNDYLKIISQDPYISGSLDKPTISAINGSAYGGGFHLAISADFRICEEEAVFRMPETDLGGTIVLWEGLPYPIAAEMMTGCPITAKRAYEVGMLNRLVPAGKTLDEAMEWAERLLKAPPLAIRRNLGIVRELYKKAAPMGRAALLDYCTQVGNTLAATEDSKAAIDAFINKKTPVYRAK